jgi:hypothetical protein
MSGSRDLVAAFGLGRRAVCRLCSLAFRMDDACDPEICEDCVEFEPGPFQDNDPPGDIIWHGPLQAPEVAVAQEARRRAETAAREGFRAVMFLHETLTAIAGQKGRALRLLPRDQSKRAAHALALFADNFPELLEAMDDLQAMLESNRLN